jgi:hypothetical protein
VAPGTRVPRAPKDAATTPRATSATVTPRSCTPPPASSATRPSSPAAILARILTTGDVGVYTAADGSRFLGLDYSTVDLTDAEAAYLEELGR